MKFDKAALLGAGLFTYSVAATGEGEAGFSNRARYPRQIGAVNTTSQASPSSLLSSHSQSTSLPLSTNLLVDTLLSSSTTDPSPRKTGSTDSQHVSLDLSSQQEPTSKATDPWPSYSTTLKTRTRGRSKASASSPSPSLPPKANTFPSITGQNSSTIDASSSTKRMRPSDRYGLTNSTAGLIPSKTKVTPSLRPTKSGKSHITGTKTRLHPTSEHRRPKAVTTVTVDCPIDGQRCYLAGGQKAVNESVSTSTITRQCTPFYDDLEPMTVYSIVHTKTVTFYGNRTDYTPPYATIETPEYCSPSATGRGGSTTEGFLPHVTQISESLGVPAPTEINQLTTLTPFARPKVTFITTDKNPSVVFPSDPPPDYSATWSDPYPSPIVHKTVPTPGGRQGNTPDADHQPRPTFSITAKGNEVVINSKTFTSLRPDQTVTVSVDGGQFTIYPTAIVGEGGSITKPAPAPTNFGVSTPTKGNVGGLDVTMSGSQVVIGGVTMTLPPYGTTTDIQGQAVTISANQIVVGKNSFKFNPLQPPSESDVVVAGGEMLTAIGQSVVVVHSKTITYGPGIPGTTEVIDGDTITIGPSGVLVHGMKMGGPQADKTDTKYEIIGGATITKIAPSIAIINGKTFTIGPGSHLTTTMIAGQEFTIGPSGIRVSTLTMTYPFGSSVVTTIAPTGTWLNNFPIETNPSTKDDDSMGSSLRPSLSSGGMALCIAIGVLVFG